jgi:hypothetical protein
MPPLGSQPSRTRNSYLRKTRPSPIVRVLTRCMGFLGVGLAQEALASPENDREDDQPQLLYQVPAPLTCARADSWQGRRLLPLAPASSSRPRSPHRLSGPSSRSSRELHVHCHRMLAKFEDAEHILLALSGFGARLAAHLAVLDRHQRCLEARRSASQRPGKERDVPQG